MDKQTQDVFAKLAGDAPPPTPAPRARAERTPEEIAAARDAVNAMEWQDDEQDAQQDAATPVEAPIEAPAQKPRSIISEALGASSPEVTDHTKSWTPDGMTEEEIEAREAAATDLMGTEVGKEYVALSLLSEGIDDITNKVFTQLAEYGRAAETLELGERTYRLSNLLTLKRKQRKQVWAIIRPHIERRTASGEGAAKLDVMSILNELIDTDDDLRLFSHLYVPEGAKYSVERAESASQLEDMEELELGQQIGALYRFFSPTVSWLPDAIQTYLLRFVRIGLSK